MQAAKGHTEISASELGDVSINDRTEGAEQEQRNNNELQHELTTEANDDSIE